MKYLIISLLISLVFSQASDSQTFNLKDGTVINGVVIEENDEQEIIALAENEYGITADMLDEDFDCYFEIFWDSNPTTREIFYFLQGLDISKNISDKLEWSEGPHPGSNYVGVTVPDLETLEDLGEELGKLGYDVRIGIK